MFPTIKVEKSAIISHNEEYQNLALCGANIVATSKVQTASILMLSMILHFKKFLDYVAVNGMLFRPSSK
jgi:hypothetical protein